MADFKSNKIIDYLLSYLIGQLITNCLKKVVEIKGDLFSVDDGVALAHCVSSDMSMGKGIAVLFRDKFKNVDYLKKQSIKYTLWINPYSRYLA